MTIFIHGIAIPQTLSADGRTTSGGCCTGTRVGGRAVAARSEPDRSGQRQTTTAPETKQKEKKRQAAAQMGAKQQQLITVQKSASCSDITGTKGGGKSKVKCPEPSGKIAAVQPVKPPAAQSGAHASQTTPGNQSGSPTVEQELALAGTIVDQLGKPLSGGIPQSATGASVDPDRDFDPRKADPYRADPPPQGRGGSCQTYFSNMLQNFERNAELCIKDKALLRSLLEASGTNTADDDTKPIDPNAGLTRNTAPRHFVQDIDPMDPRWKVSGETIEPICSLPMTVASQSEAFTECARVYLCGSRAAFCGLKRAIANKTDDCVPISRACLAEHPIPQQMTADPTPPLYKPPVQATPLPSQPHRNSTITGPSGPGGDGSGGGVRSAQ